MQTGARLSGASSGISPVRLFTARLPLRTRVPIFEFELTKRWVRAYYTGEAGPRGPTLLWRWPGHRAAPAPCATSSGASSYGPSRWPFSLLRALGPRPGRIAGHGAHVGGNEELQDLLVWFPGSPGLVSRISWSFDAAVSLCRRTPRDVERLARLDEQFLTVLELRGRFVPLR
jgi:hypothetical protein